MLQCLRVLALDKRSEPFWEPVNIYGYAAKVPNPTDLNRISLEIMSGVFTTADAFAEAVALVWSNCRLFNGKNNYYSKAASECEKLFRLHFERWVLGDNRPSVSDLPR